MQFKKAILPAVIALFVTSAVSKPPGIKHYVNNSLGFELSYPGNYQVVDLPCGVARWFAKFGYQNLLYLSTGTGKNQGNILLILDRRPFNLATLEAAHAHTGAVEPQQVQVGKLNFFFYRGGGGGTTYPDDYFYNLDGLILEISFDGPYPPGYKSPSEETRQVETRILESFQVFPAIPASRD